MPTMINPPKIINQSLKFIFSLVLYGVDSGWTAAFLDTEKGASITQIIVLKFMFFQQDMIRLNYP